MYFLGGIFVLVIMVMHLVWSEREEFVPLLKWCGDSSFLCSFLRVNSVV